jgi:hypothetical protein
MIRRILVVILLLLPLAIQAEDRGATRSGWVYLQSGSNLRISIETGHAREGWTPVTVSLAGTDVSLRIDGQGRVFPGWVARAGGRGIPLFIIDIGAGIIQLGAQSHAILVYEQNAVRTRFKLAERVIELPLSLDVQGAGGVLRFGGLEIPARISSAALLTGNPASGPDIISGSLMGGKERQAAARLSPNRIKARGK